MEVREQIDVIKNSCVSVESICKEKELIGKLDGLVQKKQLLWQEKSKEKWLHDGDQNFKFFYLFTIIRRRLNHMDLILNQDLVAVTYFESIDTIFADYFKELFTFIMPKFPSNFEGLYPSKI